MTKKKDTLKVVIHGPAKSTKKQACQRAKPTKTHKKGSAPRETQCCAAAERIPSDTAGSAMQLQALCQQVLDALPLATRVAELQQQNQRLRALVFQQLQFAGNTPWAIEARAALGCLLEERDVVDSE